MILSNKPNEKRNRSLASTCLIIFAIVSGSTAIAEDLAPNQSMTRFSSSSSNNTSNSASQEDLAKMYGLDMTQWKEYQTLLKGPRGLWSPNIHPLMALGMREGITERERRKLAKQYATVRYERVKRELAFEQAVFQEAMKMYGHIPLFKDNFESFQAERLPETEIQSQSNTRVTYFVKPDCVSCKTVIQKWLSEGKNIDIFVAGNKRQITQFAKTMGISPLLVPSRITLNVMSEKEMLSLGIKRLPAIRQAKGLK